MSAAVRFLILGSLRGGILILAVLLLRVLLRKLPKRYVCLLWTAVWLRLAMPFAMRSRFGLLPWLSFLDQSGAARSQIAAVPILSSEAASTGVANPVVSSVQPDWPLLIWIVGLVLLLLYAGIRFVLLKRKLREAIPLRGKLWLCDWVESPFLLGKARTGRGWSISFGWMLDPRNLEKILEGRYRDKQNRSECRLFEPGDEDMPYENGFYGTVVD